MAFDNDAPNSGGNTPPASPEPTSNMPTGDTLQPPAQPASQPQLQLQPASQPAPSRVFFKAVAHALGGGVLGVLAGPDPVDYKTNENGEQVAVPRKQTNIDRLRRVATAALEGMAAGAQVHRPGANALAGLGAGFTAEQQKLQQQDLLARQQDKANWEQQQKLITDRAVRAAHNAETFARHIKSQQEANDADPERQLNLAVKAGAEEYSKNNPRTTMKGDVLSIDQAHAMQVANPNVIGDYTFYPLGLRDVKDQNGNVVYESDGVTPKQEGYVYALSGAARMG